LGKFKAKWQKTDIPKHIKLVLWRIMKDNPTQTAREQAVANLKFTNEDKYWVRTSRDTFKALEQELREMPNTEVEMLPDNLKIWVRGLREEQKQLAIHKEDILRHLNELSEVANNISNRLREIRRYYTPTDEKVAELAVNYDEPELLELLDNPQAKWLLSHMKAEFSNLANLKTWADLRVKDITEELLDKLSLRAAKKEFKGSCEVCESWLNQ
jgi:hypothetical protein